MFASERGRKIFLGFMIFSWVVLLLSWIYSTKYSTISIFYPYIIVSMALLLFLCNSKPQRKKWKIGLSVLAEALLIAIPIFSFEILIILLYMVVRHENIVSSDSGPTLLHWVSLIFVSVPAVAYPILRGWKRAEVQ